MRPSRKDRKALHDQVSAIRLYWVIPAGSIEALGPFTVKPSVPTDTTVLAFKPDSIIFPKGTAGQFWAT